VIRTLVVDDDVMAVSVHSQFVQRVAGFEVVGQATSGEGALTLAEDRFPDLMLLDMYLPDLDGIEVLRRLRGSGGAPVDVIAITSAKDVAILRAAMHLGVAHYIVKPFTFPTFRDRLESYAAARQQLQTVHRPGQRDIDRIYGLLRTSGAENLPKGISAPTLGVVVDIVRSATGGISAAEIAERAGFSQGVARRYLKFLSDTGAVEFGVRYGSAGRPEHLYRWVGPAA
jgi:response regulator of citrate/malate metabolism